MIPNYCSHPSTDNAQYFVFTSQSEENNPLKRGMGKEFLFPEEKLYKIVRDHEGKLSGIKPPNCNKNSIGTTVLHSIFTQQLQNQELSFSTKNVDEHDDYNLKISTNIPRITQKDSFHAQVSAVFRECNTALQNAYDSSNQNEADKIFEYLEDYLSTLKTRIEPPILESLLRQNIPMFPIPEASTYNSIISRIH